MTKKSHGSPSTTPLGFDHLSISVASKEDLFAPKDTLEAASIEVSGAVNHGFVWSIYFFDNNNIPLEASWDCIDIVKAPTIIEDDPLAVASRRCPAATRYLARGHRSDPGGTDDGVRRQ